MSLISTSALNVINFHNVSSDASSHRVCPRLGLVDVIDLHGVANELWWGHRPHFNVRKIVSWVQRVVTSSLRLEFDNLGSSAADVSSFEISLFFVETNVKSARA